MRVNPEVAAPSALRVTSYGFSSYLVIDFSGVLLLVVEFSQDFLNGRIHCLLSQNRGVPLECDGSAKEQPPFSAIQGSHFQFHGNWEVVG